MAKQSFSDFFTIDTIGEHHDVIDEKILLPTNQTKKKIDFSRVYDGSVNKILSKALLTPDYDKRAIVDVMAKSTRKQKFDRKEAREMTAGKNWHKMPKADMTEEKQRDLELLQMRSALNPKSHYRRKDRNILPKYFEVGKIVDDPFNYYSSRMTKKERKRTMVEELMQNVELVAKTKRRYNEILQKRNAVRRCAFRQRNFLSKRSKRTNKTRSH